MNNEARPLWPRRRFIRATGLATLALAGPALAVEEKKRRSLAQAYDRAVEAFMQARGVPGGALAVVKDRRLVYARGYGWADREKRIPVRPDSLFRIASISKSITAVAVLKLIEEGWLDFDARAFDIVRLTPALQSNQQPDSRLARITVRQLLQHTGGWDRAKSFDPMFRSLQIARALGEAPPAAPRTIVRYMLGRKLDFDPGTHYAYSNFGYCVLGRVIEKITSQSYERFVQEKVLAPIGIRRMRIGRSIEGQQSEGEARYYLSDNSTARSVFPGATSKVPWPYGGFCLEAMDAHGGWIASAVDLARFAAAMDEPARCPLCRPETRRAMYAPPNAPVARKPDGSLQDWWYGCGWAVRPTGGADRVNSWHAGSLPGTFTLLVRRWDGLSWAVLFNQRSSDKKLPDEAIDAALHRAADTVADWPHHDLFSKWPSAP